MSGSETEGPKLSINVINKIFGKEFANAFVQPLPPAAAGSPQQHQKEPVIVSRKVPLSPRSNAGGGSGRPFKSPRISSQSPPPLHGSSVHIPGAGTMPPLPYPRPTPIDEDDESSGASTPTGPSAGPGQLSGGVDHLLESGPGIQRARDKLIELMTREIEKVEEQVKSKENSPKTNEGRLGPTSVKFDISSHFGSFIVSSDRLTLNSQCNFGSVRANACVFKGKWMYEVQLGSKGVMQLGWSTLTTKFSQEKGVGDSVDSYSYDGNRKRKWNKVTSPYGEIWQIGDIIGCCIDLDGGKIEYYRNGKSLGVAFKNIIMGSGVAYFPATSLSYQEVLSANFGASPFLYPIQGYHPVQVLKNLDVTKTERLLFWLQKLIDNNSTFQLSKINDGKTEEWETLVLIGNSILELLGPSLSCAFVVEQNILPFFAKNLDLPAKVTHSDNFTAKNKTLANSPNGILPQKVDLLLNLMWTFLEESEIRNCMDRMCSILFNYIKSNSLSLSCPMQHYSLIILSMLAEHKKTRRLFIHQILFDKTHRILYLLQNRELDDSVLQEIIPEPWWNGSTSAKPKSYVNGCNALKESFQSLENAQIRFIKKLLDNTDGTDKRPSSRALFLRKMRIFIRDYLRPGSVSQAAKDKSLSGFFVLVKLVAELKSKELDSKSMFPDFPSSIFYDTSIEYFDFDRVGGLSSYLYKMHHLEVSGKLNIPDYISPEHEIEISSLDSSQDNSVSSIIELDQLPNLHDPQQSIMSVSISSRRPMLNLTDGTSNPSSSPEIGGASIFNRVHNNTAVNTANNTTTNTTNTLNSTTATTGSTVANNSPATRANVPLLSSAAQMQANTAPPAAPQTQTDSTSTASAGVSVSPFAREFHPRTRIPFLIPQQYMIGTPASIQRNNDPNHRETSTSTTSSGEDITAQNGRNGRNNVEAALIAATPSGHNLVIPMITDFRTYMNEFAGGGMAIFSTGGNIFGIPSFDIRNLNQPENPAVALLGKETGRIEVNASLRELIDDALLFFSAGVPKQIDKIINVRTTMDEFIEAIKSAKEKLKNGKLDQNEKTEITKSVEVFTQKLNELSRDMAWIETCIFTPERQLYLFELLKTLLKTVRSLSADGPLFTFLPEFWVPILVQILWILLTKMPPTLPIDNLKDVDTLLIDIAEFVSCHFADTRIAIAEIKDAITQALSMFICNRRMLTALENMSLTCRQTMIKGILRPYENRAWAQSNWMLVRFWQGNGFAFEYPNPTAMRKPFRAKPVQDEFGISTNLPPIPSSIMQNHVISFLNSNQKSAASYIHSVLNQLNWTFSEFIGLFQEIDNASNRPERVFIESRQLKICATCYELTQALLRVIEMIVTLCPEVLIDFSRESSESLFSRLAMLISQILNRVGSNTGCFSEVSELKIPGLETLTHFPLLSSVSGILIAVMRSEIGKTNESELPLTKLLLNEPSFQPKSLNFLLGRNQPPLPPGKAPFSLSDYVPDDVSEAEIKSLELTIDHVISSSERLTSDNRSIPDDDVCTICYASVKTVTFFPCKHRSCRTCIIHHLMNRGECFFCKALINQVITDDGVKIHDSSEASMNLAPNIDLTLRNDMEIDDSPVDSDASSLRRESSNDFGL